MTAPIRGGKLMLRVCAVRTCAGVFAAVGLVYMRLLVVADAVDPGTSLTVHGGAGHFEELTVHELRSIWEPRGE